MNLMNWLAFHRQLKAVPASTTAERIVEERELSSYPSATYWRKAYIEETVALNGASVAMTQTIPAGARILFASYKLVGAMVLTTAVKLGLSLTGGASISSYLLTGTTMTDGTKGSQVVADAADARLTAATTATLTAAATGGTAAGTGVGSVKLRIMYEYVQNFA